MMLRFLFVLIFLFSALTGLSQMKVPCNTLVPLITPTWHFICEKYAYSIGLDVKISRTEKGGLLELTETVSDDSFYIGGTVFIYLNDNTFIVCTDKGIHKNTDGKAISLYTLTDNEMNRLKTAAITSIRFAIRGNRGPFDSQTGNFTAVNRKQHFDPYDKGFRNSFDTENDINFLYSD